MGRVAKKSGWSRSRILVLAGGLLVIIVAGVLLYASISGSPTLVINTHTYLSIGLVDASGNTRYIIPDKPIGVPGGYMATTKYLKDGVLGNYPLFTAPSLCGNVTGTGQLCLIRIASTVNRSYTLQDFFDVWGVPLGPTLTLSPSYPTNSTFFWSMCISDGGNPYEPSNDWGSHVLVPSEVVLLAYTPTSGGCA
jgi:hypothetical protein